MKLNEITLKDTHLMFEEAGTGMMKFSPGVAQVGNVWHVFLPDEKAYVEAANKSAANTIQRQVRQLTRDGKSPAMISAEIQKQVRLGSLKGTFNKAFTGAAGRAVQAASFSSIRNRTWAVEKLGKVFSSTFMKALSTIGPRLGPAGAAIGMMIGCSIEIDNIELEIQSGTGNVDELRKVQNILQAQVYTYFLAGLRMMLSSAKLIRLVLLPIKVVVRTAQGAAALTVAGAAPSLITLIISEAAWLVIPMIASMPAVQRALAEFIAGSVLGDYIAGAGAIGTAAIETASRLLDGKYGTAAMVKAMTGFDPNEATEGPTGEYYGDSEWAKNVFSGLLFPPGQASILVPYIPEQRREDLIAGVLNLNTMDINNTAPSPGADPSTSSEPGLPTNPDAVPGPQ